MPNDIRIEANIEITPADSREIKQLLERIERAENSLFKIKQESNIILPDTGEPPSDIYRLTPSSEQSHTKRMPEFPELPKGEEEITEGAKSDFMIGGNLLASNIYNVVDESSKKSNIRMPVDEEIIEGNLKNLETSEILTSGISPLQTDIPTQPILGAPTGESPKITSDMGLTSGIPAFERENMVISHEKRLQNLERNEKISDTSETSTNNILSILRNGPTGYLLGLMYKIVPEIGAILIAKGFVTEIEKELIKDGGPLDRRFKLEADKQVVKTEERETLREIRAGQVAVYVTTSNTMRGNRGTVGTNLLNYKLGIPIYSDTLESYGKGVVQ